MNLSVKHFFIILPNSSYGVIKTSIVNLNNTIELRLDYFKIISNDSKVLENLYNICLENSTSLNILKTISNELICSNIFTLNECEKLCNSLKDVNNKPSEHNKFITVNFFKGLKIPISLYNIKGIYTFIHSYYTNYNILESVMRLQSNIIKESTKNVKQTIIQPPTNISVVKSKIEPTSTNIQLNNLFELIINPSIKSHLISNILSKHEFIYNNNFKDGELKFSLVFNNINSMYIKSLIMSNKQEHEDNILHCLLKLYQMILNKEYNTSSLYLMIINYLILIYTICLYMKRHYEYTVSRLEEIILDIRLQENIMNRVLNTETIFNKFKDKIKFIVVEEDIKNINKDNDINTIKEISNNYEHIKLVSHKEFVNLIINDFKNGSSNDKTSLVLSNKKVINITQYLNNNRQNSQIKLFTIPGKNDDLENLEFELLNYSKLSNRIITKSYDNILKYIKEPSIILSLKNIPKTVISLFDCLVNSILNNEVIKKDNVNTLSYYKILEKRLPDITKFDHLTVLFIIFQIMIPYSYDIYKNEIFEDYLL